MKDVTLTLTNMEAQYLLDLVAWMSEGHAPTDAVYTEYFSSIHVKLFEAMKAAK